MLADWIFLVLSILGIWASVEIIIRSARVISERLNLSQTFIGLTFLSIGTTLPELSTHMMVSINVLRGHDLSSIALGSNFGSNIVQITAILGIAALFMSVYATRKFLKTDYVVMLGSIVLVFILSLDHLLSRIEGFILAALYLAYIYYLGRLEHFVAKVEINHRGRRVWPHFLSMGFFMLLLFLFSDLAVRGVHGISVQLSMQDSLIGAIVLGIGTALPELAMVIVAIRRGLAEMSVGVLVGSNITNPLFAAGIGALISTYSVAEDILFFDLPIWFLVSLVPLFFLWSGKRLQRKEAVLLIFLYVLYVLLRFMVVPYMF